MANATHTEKGPICNCNHRQGTLTQTQPVLLTLNTRTLPQWSTTPGLSTSRGTGHCTWRRARPTALSVDTKTTATPCFHFLSVPYPSTVLLRQGTPTVVGSSVRPRWGVRLGRDGGMLPVGSRVSGRSGPFDVTERSRLGRVRRPSRSRGRTNRGERHTNREGQRSDRQGQRQTEKQRQRETKRQRGTKRKSRDGERQTKRQREDRQRDSERQTDSERQRQRGRERKRDTETESRRVTDRVRDKETKLEKTR